MKNRKTLKKLILASFLLLGVHTLFAQTQKVQTLQAKNSSTSTTMNSDALIQMDSDNKGLLLPRIALTGANQVAPLTAHTAGMVVYNTATVVASGTGATAIEAVTPGYYYNNGTKWVKIANTDTADNTNDAWVDINNETVLATAIDSIKYSADGYKLIDKNKEVFQYQDETGAIIADDFTKASNTYIDKRVLSKNIKGSILRSRLGEGIRLIGTGGEVTGVDYLDSHNSTTVVPVGVNRNYVGLSGVNGNVQHYGAGNVGMIRGGNFQTTVGQNSKADNIRGYFSLGKSSSSFPTNTIIAGSNYTFYDGTGAVGTLKATSSDIRLINSGNVDRMVGHRVYNYSNNLATGTINNLFGQLIRLNINAATSVTNSYGLFIESTPTQTTGSNYAIFTNQGKNSFGDKVEIRTINANISTNTADKVVVADATTGELKTKTMADAVAPVAVWKKNSATNRVELGTKTDGTTTRIDTEQVVITDAGSVGVGVVGPKAKLDVNGGIRVRKVPTATTLTNSSDFGYSFEADGDTGFFAVGGTISSSSDLHIKEDGATRIFIKGASSATRGNVGVGTETPTEKLEVNGKIKASNVIFTGIPTYADDAAAGAGGLVAGEMYKTSTGVLRIKL